MNQIRIASPLYILRQECEQNLFAVLEKLKALGFDGVEFLGFFGNDPKDIKNKLEELGLTPIGNHVDYYEFLNSPEEVIKTHKIIGCSYITVSGLPKDKLGDTKEMEMYLTNLATLSDICKKQGITLLYHNHDYELKIKRNNRFLMEEILDHDMAAGISYEADLGWIEIGGGNPNYFLEKYFDRCPVIHLKDYYAEDKSGVGDVHELGSQKGDEAHSYFEFRPTGYGIANIPGLMKLIRQCNPEWLVADHDLAYERDSYFDLKISLDYIRNLLAIS